MTATGKNSAILQGLRKIAGRALSHLPFAARFSEKAPAATPGHAFAPIDPTVALFPGEADEEEKAGSLPLSTLLEDSAHAMARRKDELREPARRLAMRIAERREGEMTLTAQALRVVIGLIWLGVAVWLYISVLNARADGVSVIANTIPLDDAAVLMRTFMIVAAAGLGVAFAVAALTRGFGNGDNEHIKRDATALGGAIADAAEEFDTALSSLRGAMDQRGHPADAVDDLSRAHLTALEAHDFFREIDFLSGAGDEHSQRMFRGFLARAAGRSAGPSPIMTFILGGLVGAGIALKLSGTDLETDDPAGIEKMTLAIMQYPWAAQLIVIGGLIYAVLGVGLSFFTGPLTEGVAEKARADALAALRSGFSSRTVLHPSEVSHRIKDAVDVFRARVGGSVKSGGARRSAANAPQANQTNADFSAGDDIPEWRRRDSTAKFVDAGFSPAPESWRTDAFAKKFEAQKVRGTGAKRDGQALKNRRKD